MEQNVGSEILKKRLLIDCYVHVLIKDPMFQSIENFIFSLPFNALDSDIGRSSPKAIVVKANTGKVLNALM